MIWLFSDGVQFFQKFMKHKYVISFQRNWFRRYKFHSIATPLRFFPF